MMNLYSVYFNKFINLLRIPNTILFIEIIATSAIWRWAYSKYLHKYNNGLLLLLIGTCTWYFGFVTIIQVLVICGSSFLFAVKILKIKDYLLASIIGFFCFTQIFTLVALATNIELSYFVTLITFCLLVVCTKYKVTIHITNFATKLNTLDWALIFVVIIFGSLPQQHWDAVQANIYIAKWYVLSNSLAPIKESITSLFPQSAIVYYSLFYKAGGVKLLQLAFFLPFLMTLLLIKKIIRNIDLGLPGQIILYLTLSTPIVLFQATSGYYDNLVLLLILTATYTLFYFHSKNVLLKCFLAAFLIGFAGGSKYFPLALAPLPILVYVFSQKISVKTILPSLILVILILTPLGLWTWRAYTYTGSPVFPFFQRYFPTPKYWDASDRLEGNFMIQTSMSTSQWIHGGIFTYPLKSYLHSTQFIEGTRGYPGFIYVVFIPIQIFLLIKLGIQLVRKQRFSLQEQIFIYSFLAYFTVGLVVRYYRYLWPFQFLWLFSSLPLLQELMLKRPKLNKVLTIVLLTIIPLGYINLIDYYRYYPLDKSKVFKADYYLNNTADLTPMAYLNSRTNTQDIILDGSKFPVHRLHFKSRVYQCSWYWINWAEEIKDPLVLKNFRYLIANDPVNLSSNYCSPLIQLAATSGDYQLVYQDGTYTIYEKNN